MATKVRSASSLREKRRRVFQSVFYADGPLPASQSGITRAPQTGESQASTNWGSLLAETLLDASEQPSTTNTTFLVTPFSSQPLFDRRHGEGARRDEHERMQLDQAWRVVTSKLQTTGSAPAQDVPGVAPPPASTDLQEEEADFTAALQLVLRGLGPSVVLAWWNYQARTHFAQHVLPHLATGSQVSQQAVLPRHDTTQKSVAHATYSEHLAAVQSFIRALDDPLKRYFSSLSTILTAIESSDGSQAATQKSDIIISRYTRDLRALISHSAGAITPSLRAISEVLVEQTLRIPRAERRSITTSPTDADTPGSVESRECLLSLVEALDSVGLAGESFQVLIAEIMDRKMTEYIRRSYSRRWTTSDMPRDSLSLDKNAVKSISSTQTSWCIVSLCEWIENTFARLALDVLSRVDKSNVKPNVVSLADVQQWKEIGIERIAALRISELFDIVLQWPASRGALDDLKASVTTPQRRWQLTNAFSAALQKRLLHPARSTLDILRVYVSMIRTFHALDHSKVLLSRVVPSLQLYLVQREDAVRMVVKGLLASPEEVERAQKSSSLSKDGCPEDSNSVDKLTELAVLLNDPDQQRRMDVDEEDLDLDDMEWVPDPVDAGVNYKRPKSEDVIGTLLSTLGSEDVFIKEFQNIIAENLLSSQTDFAQEQQVLDLLKKRFGQAALQNCEVMIKDIYDSRKVDTHIRRAELGQPPRPARQFGTPSVPPQFIEMSKQLDMDEERQGQVPYHARILSRLYWPDIVQESFTLPQPVAQRQEKYETGYERLKSSRKLTWLHQLGQATVELELEDRSVNVECKTFEAAVIYAFQEEDGAESADNEPVRRSAQQLQDMLHMDEELVLQALDFWESQEVLVQYSSSPDTYVVLERKDTTPARPELHPSASAPAALEGEHPLPGMPPKPAGVKRAGTTSAMDAKENERRSTYWNFIVGMLTNTMPSMPLGQMAMMMRMLIPDGFPWSDQALQEFLTEKVELGELEITGGKYKLVKK